MEFRPALEDCPCCGGEAQYSFCADYAVVFCTDCGLSGAPVRDAAPVPKIIPSDFVGVQSYQSLQNEFRFKKAAAAWNKRTYPKNRNLY